MNYLCVNKDRNKSGRITIYGLMDNYGVESIITSNELKRKIRNHEIKVDNLILTKDNRLREVSIDIDKIEMSCDVAFGDRLNKQVKKHIRNYRERFIVKDIYKYMKSESSPRVCCIFGLRRTGKTVAMMHTIKRLLSENKKVVYINMTDKDNMGALISDIKKLWAIGYEYLFIDEISDVDGLYACANVLSDIYAAGGMKIAISGTNSYMLSILFHSKLYDRVFKVSSTYIGYKEMAYLLGIGLEGYIRTGGVLETDILYDKKHCDSYISNSIVYNIIKSMNKANNYKEFFLLQDLDKRGLLSRSIENTVEYENRTLTKDVITDIYRSGELGSSIEKVYRTYDIGGKLNVNEVTSKIRYLLNIVNDLTSEFNEEYAEELRDMLIDIDVLTEYHRYIGRRQMKVALFTQPGIRYNQSIAIIQALTEDESFNKLDMNTQNLLIQKVREGTEGSLIEHEVINANLKIAYRIRSIKNIEVCQCNYKSQEWDMMIHDDKYMDIYEVKRSNKRVREQCRWLVSKEICEYYTSVFGCQIRNRYVLYMGEDTDIACDKYRIHYRNVEKYLKGLNAKNIF